MKFKLIEDVEMSNEYDSEGNQLTREQAEFFKNSKIRDKQGRLLVCYHGTNAKFDRFDKSKFIDGSFGRGFYFTANESEALEYGSNVIASYVNIANPYYIGNTDDDKKLIDYLEKSGVGFDVDDALEASKYGNIIEYFDFEPFVTDAIEKLGYDGIQPFSDMFVAFEPNQIKSIANKTPTNSDNINESLMMKSGMYVFDTASSLMNFLRNQKKDIRILYDANLDKYFACDGNEYIHWDMLEQAQKEGYYHGLVDYQWELDNYQYTGVNGGWDENDEYTDPYLYYIIFSPDNSFEIGDDDYDEQYDTSIGRFLTRDSDIEEIDLYDYIKREMK